MNNGNNNIKENTPAVESNIQMQTNTYQNDASYNPNNFMGIGKDIPDSKDNSLNNGSNLNNNIKKSKKSYSHLIFFIILTIILIALAGVVTYIINAKRYTAENYLDTNIATVTNYINNNIPDYNYDDIDLVNDDIKSSGSINILSSTGKLSALNNLELNYVTSASISNDYIDANFTLKQGNGNISATTTVDKSNAYIDAKDIYNNILRYEMDTNIFTDLKDELSDYSDLLNPNDIKILLTNLVKYLGEAIKKSDISTSIKGLTVEYKYEINDSNKDKINELLKNYLKNDPILNKVNKLTKKTNTINTNYSVNVNNLSVVVVINALKGSLNSITIKTDNATFKGTLLEDNTYKFVNTIDNSNYIIATIAQDKIAMEIYEDSISSKKVSLESTDNNFTFTIDIPSKNLTGKISIEKISTDSSKIYIDITKDKFVLKANMTAMVSGKKNSLDGTVKVTTDDIYLSLKLSEETEYGSEIVTKKTINNARNIATLSIDEITALETNLLTKLSEFNFTSTLIDIYSNYLSSSTYDDYTDYDLTNTSSDFDDYSF